MDRTASTRDSTGLYRGQAVERRALLGEPGRRTLMQIAEPVLEQRHCIGPLPRPRALPILASTMVIPDPPDRTALVDVAEPSHWPLPCAGSVRARPTLAAQCGL